MSLVAPPKTPSGSYEPVAMYEFLAACIKTKCPTNVIARTLGIEPHRAIYATGIGLEQFRKRALKAQGVFK